MEKGRGEIRQREDERRKDGEQKENTKRRKEHKEKKVEVFCVLCSFVVHSKLFIEKCASLLKNQKLHFPTPCSNK